MNHKGFSSAMRWRSFFPFSIDFLSNINVKHAVWRHTGNSPFIYLIENPDQDEAGKRKIVDSLSIIFPLTLTVIGIWCGFLIRRIANSRLILAISSQG